MPDCLGAGTRLFTPKFQDRVNQMDFLIKYAMSFIGLPYRWSGDDSIDGFDCSGFVQEVLSSVGMDPRGDQTAQGLYDYFKSSDGQRGVLSRGSLCFFGSSETRISHIAIAIDSWRIIEAGGGGSNTVSRAAAAKHNAFIRIRPINSRSNLIESIFPSYNTKEMFP